MFKIGFLSPSTGTAPTYVQIDTQRWSIKNLDVVTYRDTTAIPYAANATQWNTYSGSGVGCYASVNYNSANDAEYGLLYNGYAIQNTVNGGLAPEGWHIPTQDEVTTLVNYLGGFTIAGGPLKETGTTHWNSPNSGATNSSGFTALGTGLITNFGVYTDFKQNTYYGCYGNLGITVPCFTVSSATTNAVSSNNAIEAGYSVRLIRNDSLVLGYSYGGGTIFQIEGDPMTNGTAYIVLDDLTFIDSYGCDGTDIGAHSNDDFIANTTSMDVNSCNTAATVIRTPTSYYNFSDWYLAARDQVQIILDDNRVTGISTSDRYWTSTEVNTTSALSFVWSTGGAYWDFSPDPKTNSQTFFVIRAQQL